MMKIGEFALLNGVTAKMLRNYDEIGLLQPECVDPQTGYRLYAEHQAKYLSWVLLLKELNFSLSEIGDILRRPNDSEEFLRRLKNKRIEISDSLKTQQSKSMQITRLIQIIEKEGFELDKKINLLSMPEKGVIEIMKSMPNTGAFLERVGDMLSGRTPEKSEYAVFIRADADRLKHINDTYGLVTGDRVISLLFTMLDAAARAVFTDYTIARTHGDEFVVFAFGNREEAEALARNVYNANQQLDMEALALPCRCDCCLGIALLRNPGSSWRLAFEYTYEALSQAKHKGSNSCAILEYPEYMEP